MSYYGDFGLVSCSPVRRRMPGHRRRRGAPLLIGLAADRFGLQHALLAPVICYMWIMAYGLPTRSGRVALARTDAALGSILE